MLKPSMLRRCAVLLLICCSATTSAASLDKSITDKFTRAAGAFSVSSKDGRTLLLEGEIKDGDEAKFFAALTPQVKTLMLNSGGGDVRPALKMARAVRTRRLQVIVDGLCGSSCANYLFVAGSSQEVKPDSVVLWHGGVTDKIIADLPALFRAEMARQGLPPEHAKGPSEQTIAEWRAVQSDQRSFYKELGLPITILEGLHLAGDWTATEGATREPGQMIFIDYEALRCVGVRGLRSAWSPSESWCRPWSSDDDPKDRQEQELRAPHLLESCPALRHLPLRRTPKTNGAPLGFAEIPNWRSVRPPRLQQSWRHG